MTATTTLSTLERLKAIIGDYTEGKDGWFNTSCPTDRHAHGDQRPSLGFKEFVSDLDATETRLGFNCFAGCSEQEILAAYGLTWKDLYSKPDGTLARTMGTSQAKEAPTIFDLEEYTRLPRAYLFFQARIEEKHMFTFHKKDGTPYRIVGFKIPYHTPDGAEHERSRLRRAIHKTAKDNRFLWSEGDETPPAYGLQNLHKAIETGYVVIVEGESDTWTLDFHGIPALGIPGANNIKKTLDGALLAGIPRVYVVQEKTDQAGINFPFAVQVQLRATGYTGEILRVPLRTLTGAKDPNELHKQVWDKEKPYDHEAFRVTLQQTLEQATPMSSDTAEEALTLDQAIAAGSIKGVYSHAAELAQLSELDLARVKATIRTTFGNLFPMREFNDLIKAEQASAALAKRRKVEIKSARSLMTRTFPTVQYKVEKILPAGLIVLGGKQKIGKSWLDECLSISVAAGTPALGSLKTQQGNVLLMALEDNERRLQERLEHLLGPDETMPADLDYVTEWPRMNEGGLDALEEWIASKPNPQLVIIDPWVKVKPRVKSRQGETGYDADYEMCEGVKRLADKYDICIIIQCHLRKASADDPFDELNASTGLTACADGFLLLRRARGESDATLWGTGRDYKEDVDLALSFNDGLWAVLGNAQAYALTKASKEVIDLLNKADAPMYPKEIADALSTPVGTIRKRLMDMKERGEIKDTGLGYISLIHPDNDLSNKGNEGNGRNGGNAGNAGNGQSERPTPFAPDDQSVTSNQERYLSENDEVTAFTPPVESDELMSVTSVTPVTTDTNSSGEYAETSYSYDYIKQLYLDLARVLPRRPLHWDVIGSGIPTSSRPVQPSAYHRNLKQCIDSRDPERVKAAVLQMEKDLQRYKRERA